MLSQFKSMIASCTICGVLTIAAGPAAAAEKDIVDTAVAAGSFKTLATALTEADLVKALKGKGPFTVFAPTDEAFKALPKETLADLLKPENKEKLVAILTYHVVADKVMAADVVKLKEAKTLSGKKVSVSVKGGEVMIDGAKVVKTDIQCSNGVIHVIDKVLIPKQEEKKEAAAVSAGHAHYTSIQASSACPASSN